MLPFLVFSALVDLVLGYGVLKYDLAWNQGFKANFSLQVNQTYHTWCLRIVFDEPINCIEIWRAYLVDLRCKGRREFLTVNKIFNADLPYGIMLDMTLNGHTNHDHFVGGKVYLEENCHGCKYSDNFPEYTQIPKDADLACNSGTEVVSQTANAVTKPTTQVPTSSTKLTTFHFTTYKVNGVVTNSTGVPYTASQTPGNVTKFNATHAQYTTSKASGSVTVSPNAQYTMSQVIGNVTKVTHTQYSQVSINASSNGHSMGLTDGMVPSSTAMYGYNVSTKYDYKHALGLSILFYDAQRSGDLPDSNPIPWRNDSAVNDSDSGVDLSGGWYDAGDHVKFNFPMSSSATNLLWGMEKWKDAYHEAGKLDEMYDMIKWPLDYFLKCWQPANQTYYVQVGNGPTDHFYRGTRPEDMKMWRPTYKITPTKPGSDVAGETAASLAAGSIVFKDKDANYSTKLLDAAKSLYKFAKDNKGLYSQSVPEAQMYYGSSNYTDELCEGAAWLYKATKDQQYLRDAQSFYTRRRPEVFNWEDKTVSCQMLLYEITHDDQYKHDVEAFVTSNMPNGSKAYTPCGLVFVNQWGSLRYASNAAMIALLAAENGFGGDKYKEWALSQMNYILGDNNKNTSYEIGFGPKYPIHPYHWSNSNSNTLLKGALVGGPGIHDDYQDKPDDYQKNEVACDYNAGFQSALAGLIHFAHTGQLPPSPPAKC